MLVPTTAEVAATSTVAFSRGAPADRSGFEKRPAGVRA